MATDATTAAEVHHQESSDNPAGDDDGDWTILFQGAESRVYHGHYAGQPAIRKDRFRKNYRHLELDKKLARQRTKAEVRAYEKIRKQCPELADRIPKVLHHTERTIILTRVMDAVNLGEYIDRNIGTQTENISAVLKTVGHLVAQLHGRCSLIHGDLTTSNFLVMEENTPVVIPIDFGLSYSSHSDEDRAVDLYVLERAIQSTHPSVAFEPFLQSYRDEMGEKDGEKIIQRLDLVRMRGRKRSMVG